MTCSRSRLSPISFCEPRIERLRHHQHAGAAVGQHEAVVVLGHQRVDRHGNDAGLEAAEERGRPVDGVEQRDQHPLLAPHPERAQAAANRATRSARGAGADRAARHHRLAYRLPRLPQDLRRCRSSQYADDRGRLPLHAGRQPRPRAGGVGRAHPRFAEADRRKPQISSTSSCRASARRGPQNASRSLVESAMAEAHTAPTVRDDIALLALHLGLDRQAQGRSARPCRS